MIAQTTANYELTQVSVRDCSDVGKMALSDEDECKKAASQLSLTYHTGGSWSNNPKGCVLWKSSNIVWWNFHQSGREKIDWFVICRTSGMCSISIFHRNILSKLYRYLS